MDTRGGRCLSVSNCPRTKQEVFLTKQNRNKRYFIRNFPLGPSLGRNKHASFYGCGNERGSLYVGGNERFGNERFETMGVLIRIHMYPMIHIAYPPVSDMYRYLQGVF